MILGKGVRGIAMVLTLVTGILFGFQHGACLLSSAVAEKSDTVRTEEYEVTALKIYTEGDILPNCEYVSHKAENFQLEFQSITNNYFVPCRILLCPGSSDRSPIMSNGAIKIRGNTSAGKGVQKKPYRLKLEEPLDLLRRDDDRYNHKKWVLLAFSSNLRTIIGLKVAQLCGIEWEPECEFVNLYINDEYRGCYLLIESVDVGSNRVDISRHGFIIENNAYWWKENEVYFKGKLIDSDMGFTLKYPDEDEISDEELKRIKNYINDFEETLLSDDESYQNYIDMDSWIAWILAHDILGTIDSRGSNMYLYKEDDALYGSGKLKAGPLWDFDAIYGLNDKWASVHREKCYYYAWLFEHGSFASDYVEHWKQVSRTLVSEMDSYLNDLYMHYGSAINRAWEMDAERWNMESQKIEDEIARAKQWFRNRVQWLNEVPLLYSNAWIENDNREVVITLRNAMQNTSEDAFRCYIWSDENGQDDLCAYSCEYDNGAYVCKVPLENHQSAGKYYVHVYQKTDNGEIMVYDTQFYTEYAILPKYGFRVEFSNDGHTAAIFYRDEDLMTEVQELRFHVWSDENGQDDLAAYEAQLLDGEYVYEVPLEAHHSAGMYYVHVYTMKPEQIVRTWQFEVSKAVYPIAVDNMFEDGTL